MRRSFALSLIMSLFVAASAFATGEARLTGKIIDATTREPIPNATFKIEAVEGKTVKKEDKGRKDGGYTVFLLDGTIKYKFTFSAPGYAPYEETMKLKLGEPNIKDIELRKVGEAAPGAAAPIVDIKDPAVDAYNEGALLANAGKTAEAIAKFEEAVAAKPDLTAGWMALAKSAVKAKQWDKAINAAKKALEIDDEDAGMWTALYQSYVAKGDKANAAIAEKKLPANASALFNQAARLINEGKDGEAETALKQAVSVDEKFAVAWYELGMVYVRTGKNSDARDAFTKYLALDPNGKDAATAKEMMNYIK
jgi:tetratricopeptide (TPR) repeat protein